MLVYTLKIIEIENRIVINAIWCEVIKRGKKNGVK